MKLLADPASRIAIALFSITLGPMVEELLFRGFLQPVLVGVAGVFPGILVTSALFGGLHLMQNDYIWQSGLLITLIGFALGTIRHVSGSTRASTNAHIGYNSLPFLGLLLQSCLSTRKINLPDGDHPVDPRWGRHDRPDEAAGGGNLCYLP